MGFVLKNYIIIIIIGLFLIFALIGYLIDMYRKSEFEKDNNIVIPKEISELEKKEEIINNEENVNNEQIKEDSIINNNDDLLNNYNNE